MATDLHPAITHEAELERRGPSLVALLRELRAESVADLTRHEAVTATAPDARGEDLTPSQHPADVASDLYAREGLIGEALAIRARIRLIDDALARLGRAEYGRCADCGRDIPLERLEVLPFAVRCVDCQRREERR